MEPFNLPRLGEERQRATCLRLIIGKLGHEVGHGIESFRIAQAGDESHLHHATIKITDAPKRCASIVRRSSPKVGRPPR